MQKNNVLAGMAFFIAGWFLRCFPFLISFLLAGAGISRACPQFVEFFPDPTDVPDQQGEFVEIRFPKEDVGDIYAPDSIWVQFENKSPISLLYPRTERLVLVHDSVYCPTTAAACALLGNVSLPNSRESDWNLVAGTCKDSVHLSVPKAGKSFQRVKFSDEWTLAEPTFGKANSRYELDVVDCRIDGLEAIMVDSLDPIWNLNFILSGCDSSWLKIAALDLYSGKLQGDSILVRKSYSLSSIKGDALQIKAYLPADDGSYNDSLDTLVTVSGRFPLVISEIHHCPDEPEPEWVEVLNRGKVILPLQKLSFCNRGHHWDGIVEAGESLVFTKDTLGLRNYLSFRDVELRQIALGFLNNTAGNISICYGNLVLDSVYWDKSLVSCPQGFNPLTGLPENTPGYQSPHRSSIVGEEIKYKLSSRVLQKNKTPLLVYVECESVASLKLLDSAGKILWNMKIPAGSREWWNVPVEKLHVGVAYIEISYGKKEKIIGILVRP